MIKWPISSVTDCLIYPSCPELRRSFTLYEADSFLVQVYLRFITLGPSERGRV